MTGKHYGWHKAWGRSKEGRLSHSSGLEFDDMGADAALDTATLEKFKAHELGRGVPVHDHARRLQRLCWEAREWLEHERRRRR